MSQGSDRPCEPSTVQRGRVDKYGVGEDPYTYPGSDVLRNRLGIRDAGLLEAAERDFSRLAVLELPLAPPPYDFNYFCHLHKALFGEVYSWAGQIRTVDIAKGDSRFCNVNFIGKEASKLFSRLAQENYLQGLEQPAMAARLAEYYCDINVLHPFRDGNGRAQRLLFEHITASSGFNLNFADVTQEEWVQANIAGCYGQYAPMQQVMERALHVL